MIAGSIVAGCQCGVNVVELLKIELPQAGEDKQLTRQMEALRDSLGSAMRLADQLAGTPTPSQSNHAITERHIRNMQKLRRHRERFFTADLFADPAGDILLELYAAKLGQYKVSVSNLCVAAAVPPTTALRWINLLEGEGLIDRKDDPIDGRRKFVMLSEKAVQAMNAYFTGVPVSAQLI